MKRFILLVGLIALAGCSGPDSPEVKALNKDVLSGPGDYIGTLPNGQDVVRYEINRGDNLHNHFIYVVGDTVTVNRSESQGKSSVNRTETIYNGSAR